MTMFRCQTCGKVHQGFSMGVVVKDLYGQTKGYICERCASKHKPRYKQGVAGEDCFRSRHSFLMQGSGV